jgi:hypothetical protein
MEHERAHRQVPVEEFRGARLVRSDTPHKPSQVDDNIRSGTIKQPHDLVFFRQVVLATAHDYNLLGLRLMQRPNEMRSDEAGPASHHNTLVNPKTHLCTSDWFRRKHHALNEVAQNVLDRNVALLNALDILTRHNNRYIHERGNRPTSLTQQPDGRHSDFGSSFHGLNHILRPSACRDNQQYVFRSSQSEDLTLKDAFKTEIISPRGEDRRIRCQRNGGHRRSWILLCQDVHELGREVLRISRTPTVPA